ncbi:AraC-type transcriptional regulator N-terminus [Streptomyces sp. DvalAA-14]|nr:AraC-type transcriptional regulator N-terminus [Streptomyces sp. DvalAA-14]
MVRLLLLLDEPRDRAVLAPLVKREILWRLITGGQGATVRQLGLADSSLGHVSRAVRWIREHYAQPFRVEDVARRQFGAPPVRRPPACVGPCPLRPASCPARRRAGRR